VHESLAKHNSVNYVVLVVDGDPNQLREEFATICPYELGIIDLEAYLRKYDAFEISNFLRPFFFKYLLKERDVSNLIYLDCDVYVTGSLAKVEAMLARHPILLTPHLVNSAALLRSDREKAIDRELLLYGAFNSGFYALRGCDETTGFLEWLSSKAKDRFFNDAFNDLFVDQRWLDLAPSFFDILPYRDTDLNVAYWNLHEREITAKDGRYYSNAQPMVFFHFSAFNPLNGNLSKFSGIPSGTSAPALNALIKEYSSALLANGYLEYKKYPYRYDLWDGQKLTQEHRRRGLDSRDRRRFTRIKSWLREIFFRN
jgi:hypothetical protein